MDLQQLFNQAEAAKAAGNAAEAERMYREILAIQPVPEVLVNLGNLIAHQGRLDEALACHERALAANPGLVVALFNHANLLADLQRHEEALAGYDQALGRAPGMAGIWNNRGNALRALRRVDEALASYQRATALVPGHLNSLTNCAIALWDLKRFPEALAAVARALAVQPHFSEALYVRGNILNDLGQVAEAKNSYAAALAGGHPHALNGLARAALMLCDWPQAAVLAPRLRDAVLTGSAPIQPFILMGYSDDAALQRRCAERVIRRLPPRPALWKGERHGHAKIRIAYLSADFHQHPTAALIADLLERHDRSRFEISAIAFGPDDGSALRSRIMRAVDRFEDVRSLDDGAVAKMLRAREIDIAIDLNGHTQDARPGILSWRPCPVQVNWLGYPGTLGAAFIDLVIADAVVLPPTDPSFMTEKIVRLPDCYQPNDATRRVGSAPSRGKAGLPDHGFVFCCFNAPWKITAPVFDIWMRLLAAVPGSVLWLMDGPATGNLRREAVARGIDPARLVFAPKQEADRHLARHTLADLFLDTLPYNAHTTASDALWAGLPVLTCRGKAFPGRVAASQLTALEMPELIMETPQAYEARALDLARDRDQLSAARDKLSGKRGTAPLFDSDRFRRAIEAVYAAMLEAAPAAPSI